MDICLQQGSPKWSMRDLYGSNAGRLKLRKINCVVSSPHQSPRCGV